MSDASEPQSLQLRLRRGGNGFFDWWQRNWQQRWFRIAVWLAGAALVGWFLLWLLFARNLPSVEQLKNYQPPLPSHVRSIDGTPIHSYARERRVQLKFEEYPPQLIRAFLAAEDKTFFEHGGIDYAGIVSAIVTNLFDDRRVGASTITQQVAKNLLLSPEQTYTRKIKEMFLARRIESTLTKQQILELYFNQIFLGRNAYGVQAASRAYFNKDVRELALHESAYLAILPKAPANYTPERHEKAALERRKFVLDQMLDNDFITEAEHAAAIAMPLGTVARAAQTREANGGYFLEEVRRELIDRFGDKDEAGRKPYSVYEGGLWVRTSLDPRLQTYAEEALRAGLMRYDQGRGWMGEIKTIDPGPGWAGRLERANLGAGYADWRVAVVLAKAGQQAQLGFADGSTGILPSWGANSPKRKTGQPAFAYLQPGHVILVKQEGANWVLRSQPEVSGGMVVQDPHNGRVLAMQGGFDSRIQSYNRATQAWRQPGSSFKPFVYAAALDAGMTPASIIVDGSFCVYQGARYGRKCFKNFGGAGGAGPQTMRWGLEQSRNLMTVRAASQTGMEKVVKLAAGLGVNKAGEQYQPVLAIALGAGETTVLKMVNAYSILARNGRDLKPTLIDYVQDRNGKVILRADKRPCERCNMANWDGKPMPRPPLSTKQAMDPVTAYQTVHMLEGVVQRGTATQLKKLERPFFGKTGTTTGPTNVWFVGGSADMIAGVYIGFDQPRPMGHYAQGGTMAVPIIYDFASKAMEGMRVVPFRAPAGTRMVRIDRKSGKRVFGAWPGNDPMSAVIWEAFKAEAEPRRSIRRDELEKPKKEVKQKATVQSDDAARGTASQNRDSEFLQREGQIY